MSAPADPVSAPVAAARAAAARPARRPRARAAGLLGLFLCSAAAFWLSPIRYLTDSRYSFLVSQSLLRHGELALDRYFDPSPAKTRVREPVLKVVVAGTVVESRVQGRLPLPQYTVEQVRGRVHYYFPHASSILSLPYVAVMRLAGLSVVDHHGRYREPVEERLQAGLAALLMGAATVLFYLTARELVPLRPSLAVAAVGGFGTQVWSTASRVLWSDTWGVTLLSVVVWMLVAAHVRGRRLNPLLLGSLLAWTYFVRPTNSVHVLVVMAYLGAAHRAVLAPVTAVGAAWGAAFVAYSWTTFGTLLPSYFAPGRLVLGHVAEALLGNLVSPSRGILFYAPVVLLAAALLVRHWRDVRPRGLAVLALAGLCAQFVPVLLFDHWWGGYCYGPRLLVGLVPWAVLAGAVAARALIDAHAASRAPRYGWRFERVVIVLVCAWSVLVNGRGAVVAGTERWNVDPVDIDALPSRVWDWRHPQFLAGLGERAPRPRPGVRVALGRSEADAFFGAGWSSPEGELRWSVARRAGLRLRWPARGSLVLRMQLRPAPAWQALGGQAVTLWLDGRELTRWRLAEAGPAVYSTIVEAERPGEEHRLELEVPDLDRDPFPGPDQRPLRTAIYALRIDPLAALSFGQRLPLGHESAAWWVGTGWGVAEGTYRWTVAPRAEVYFGAAEPTGAILRVRMHPFVQRARSEGQRVFVGLNGSLVGTVAVAGPEAREHAIALPAELRLANTLTLDLPDAAPPFRPTDDPRRLGVAVHWMQLDRFPGLAPGQRVALGRPEAGAYLGDGWAEPEGATRWTDGLAADVFFAAPPSGAARLALVMEPFLHERLRSQRVRLELNGEALAALTLDRPGRRVYELPLPRGALGRDNVLRLVLPDARSPASLGAGRDQRRLGVRVADLELRP